MKLTEIKDPTYKSTTKIIGDRDMVHDFFAGDYSQAFERYKAGLRMFRGLNNVSDEVFIDNSYKVKRRSITSSHNIYNDLFANKLSSWEKYPSREHCVIGSFNFEVSESFGTAVYVVFPKNNTKIAYCDVDFIGAFAPSLKTLYKISPFKESYQKDPYPQISLQSLDKYIDDICTTQKISLAQLLDQKIENETVLQLLDRLLNPIWNDFNLEPINSIFDRSLKHDSEFWFSNTCLMIDCFELEKILDEKQHFYKK